MKKELERHMRGRDVVEQEREKWKDGHTSKMEKWKEVHWNRLMVMKNENDGN